MKPNTFFVLALCLVPTFAIPPASFGFPESEDDTPLSVHFEVGGSQQAVEPGLLFGIDVPAQQPIVAVNESYNSLNYEYNGQYLLFMVDPDASYPQNPTNRFIVHFWQEGLTRSTSEVNNTGIGGTLLMNTTAPRIEFRRPSPPTNSSAHRYILYLFKQPSNFQIPEQYSGYSSTNRSRFPFEQFLDDAQLSDPVAANYFYCSNETAVPNTFVAAPGSTYPGGNGAMITQGTNNPTPTGTASTATASSSSPVATIPAQGTGVVYSGNAALGLVLGIGAAWALLWI